MIEIAISTTIAGGGEYAQAVEAAGGQPLLLNFSRPVDDQLAGVAGVLLSGGGDVDPRRYGAPTNLATEIDSARDDFEIALVHRARERGLPTLCICRGLQIANVAFGGTLVGDLASAYGSHTAALHRLTAGDAVERGLIAGHDVTVMAGSLLSSIACSSSPATGSRHHQSLATVAADLQVVGTTPDRIVEAAEARFASPFWLGVQWHPESTLACDDGTSRAIFAAFVGAARAVRRAA